MTSSQQDRRTILVVEDNIFIRLDITEYLRRGGYHVLDAENAAEAINVLESQPSIDLVFSDIQMPGDIDGFGLARWVKKHQPAVKVILTSGYVKVDEEVGELYADGPMILKPYDQQLVAERIRQNLGPVGSRRERRVPAPRYQGNTSAGIRPSSYP